jgi:hypothetical protein
MLDRVRDAFEKAKDRASFMHQLDQAGLDLYVRGQTRDASVCRVA